MRGVFNNYVVNQPDTQAAINAQLLQAIEGISSKLHTLSMDLDQARQERQVEPGRPRGHEVPTGPGAPPLAFKNQHLLEGKGAGSVNRV